MSQNRTRDLVRPGTTGDTTTGPKSMSEITTMNPTFISFLNKDPLPPQPPSPKPMAEPAEKKKALEKPSFDELTKQARATLTKRPLIDSEETINSLQRENFSLKLALATMKSKAKEEILNADTENYERDVLTTVMEMNERLRQQLENRDRDEEERKKRCKDASCQTHLDNVNMEELMKARVALKNQQNQQGMDHYRRRQYVTQSQPTQPTTAKHPRHEERTHHQVVTQLTYPNVALPRSSVPINCKQMAPDEKELLEQLYTVHGIMTTAKDKLRAVVDTNK